MTNEEFVQYWMKSARHDHPVMRRNFASGDYSWALFIGHLVIEKLLKACCARRMGANVPKTHNLSRLADMAGLALEPETRERLDRLTAIQATIRYPDLKPVFRGKAGKIAAGKYMREIRELRKWLLAVLSA